MITDRTLTLLQSLSQTRSPSKQLLLIAEYCVHEANMKEQSDQINGLLGSYKQLVEEAHQQGIVAVSKRKKIVKPHERPKFFLQFKGRGNCSHCNAFIDGSQIPIPAFWHRFGKDKQDVNIYCPLPSCFPDEFKSKMLEDRDYIKTLKSK